MTTLVSGRGRPVAVGEQIGSGGEGAVYALAGDSDGLVAKLYHRTPTADKQQKLRAMTARADAPLAAVAAWPQEILQSCPGGPVCGFVMTDARRYQPLHHLYGPSHRKRLFPDKDWRFLVNAARNIAAAFDVVHRSGLVIGDINPNSIFVSADSTVKLIDCDSFQFDADGKRYLCEVGVPHFTPPELQRRPSFSGLARTRNHDNFGLAVLIFHVLLMGRHPYAGIFSGAGDMPLETAIAEFRYAYGGAPAKTMTAPPPNSVGPDILPAAVRRLFDQAFLESGADAGRPAPRLWLEALTNLQRHLRPCPQESCHHYFDGLSACPWCYHEQRNRTFYFIAREFVTGGLGHFNMADIWAQITRIPHPGPPPGIRPAQPVTLPPLAPALVKARRLRLGARAASAASALAGVALPALLPILLPAGGVLLFWQSPALAAAVKARTASLKTAERAWRRVFRQWQAKAGSGRFELKLNELGQLKQALEALPNRLAAEKQKLQANPAGYQMHQYLDRFFLADHAVRSVGPARKATLASFGIETAADITWAKVGKIRGFGSGRTKALVEWRQQLERGFVFEPNKPVEPADIGRLNRRYAKKRQLLEQRLLQGAAQLAAARDDILRQRDLLRPAVEAAASQLAQAEAELARLR